MDGGEPAGDAFQTLDLPLGDWRVAAVGQQVDHVGSQIQSGLHGHSMFGVTEWRQSAEEVFDSSNVFRRRDDKLLLLKIFLAEIDRPTVVGDDFKFVISLHLTG